MAFEHRPGTFSLFKNSKKTNDKAPDYRGEGKDAAGNEIEVAAWLNEGAKGKFMSCNFKIKGERTDAHAPAPKPAPKPQEGGSTFDDMDDDIPF